MRCAACGQDNLPGKKFCAHCGAPLQVPAHDPGPPQFCRSCGATLNGKRFCPQCGVENRKDISHKSTEERPPAPQPEAVQPAPNWSPGTSIPAPERTEPTLENIAAIPDSEASEHPAPKPTSIITDEQSESTPASAADETDTEEEYTPTHKADTATTQVEPRQSENTAPTGSEAPVIPNQPASPSNIEVSSPKNSPVSDEEHETPENGPELGPEAEKFCKICGAVYGNGAFCRQCGKGILPGSADNEAIGRNPPPQGRLRTYIWITLASILALAAAFAVYYFVLQPRSATPAVKAPTNRTVAAAPAKSTASSASVGVATATVQSPSAPIANVPSSSTAKLVSETPVTKTPLVKAPVVASREPRHAAAIALPQSTSRQRYPVHEATTIPKQQGMTAEQMKKLLSPFGGND